MLQLYAQDPRYLAKRVSQVAVHYLVIHVLLLIEKFTDLVAEGGKETKDNNQMLTITSYFA